MYRTIMGVVFAFALAGAAHAAKPIAYKAHLEGFNAGGVAIPTNANGNAMVEVIDGGTALAFKVNVSGINNLLMAHIHVQSFPVEITDPAGPLAFWFVGGPPPGTTLTETVNGRLAEGFIITNGQLLVWDAADPTSGTIAGLVAAIEEGRASVVVHTDDLNPATPTGVAGDSRAGELRGTLR